MVVLLFLWHGTVLQVRWQFESSFAVSWQAAILSHVASPVCSKALVLKGTFSSLCRAVALHERTTTPVDWLAVSLLGWGFHHEGCRWHSSFFMLRPGINLGDEEVKMSLLLLPGIIGLPLGFVLEPNVLQLRSC